MAKTAVGFTLLRLGAAVRMSSECINDEGSSGILAPLFWVNELGEEDRTDLHPRSAANPFSFPASSHPLSH